MGGTHANDSVASHVGQPDDWPDRDGVGPADFDAFDPNPAPGDDRR